MPLSCCNGYVYGRTILGDLWLWRHHGFLAGEGTRIDELPGADEDAFKWSVWVNARPFKGGDRLGTDTSFGFHPDEREANLLKPGDHVVIKLSQATKNPR